MWPRPFEIDELRQPRLAAWAAKGRELEEFARDAARAGVTLSPVPLAAAATDGVMLSWRYTDPRTVVENGIVPFFIDWGSSPHPGATAAPGASPSCSVRHPEAQRVQNALIRLGIDLAVRQGPRATLIATVGSP